MEQCFNHCRTVDKEEYQRIYQAFEFIPTADLCAVIHQSKSTNSDDDFIILQVLHDLVVKRLQALESLTFSITKG